MCYLIIYDVEKHFQIENPVNRLNMYSIGEIEKIWNGNEKIQDELKVFEGKNKGNINANTFGAPVYKCCNSRIDCH